MDRRRLAAVVLTMAGIALLVLAASSGPVRVWSNPAGPRRAAPEPSPAATTTAVPNDTVPPDDGTVQPWGGSLLPYLGMALLLVAMVIVVRTAAGRDWSGRRGASRRRRLGGAPLPLVDEPELVVDLAAIREALAGGEPRNAIVACWMRLERDAAAAGLQRAAAETSLEYVERVVAASSVDPGPIRELAQLYREARFSQHAMGEDDRERAGAALQQVVEALRRSVPEPA